MVASDKNTVVSQIKVVKLKYQNLCNNAKFTHAAIFKEIIIPRNLF